jgi:hypothetical protein
MIRVLSLAGLQISKHELSAFFRKPGHKHYRECKNQMLHNFLKGLQLELSLERMSPKTPEATCDSHKDQAKRRYYSLS